MDSTKTAEPESSSALSEGHDFVGVTLQSAMPLECNQLAARMFWAAMDAGLRRRDIEPTGSGGLFGPCFMLWSAPTQDPNPLLRAVEEIIKEDLDFWPWETVEVACAHRSEGFWRTMHPCGAPPFERWLTEEKFCAARQAIGLQQEALINGASDLRRWLREIRGKSQ